MCEAFFLTISGMNHYYGVVPFRPGVLLLLVKEPDNPHDEEAIRVELISIGKVGYVANSVHSVIPGTMSAGRAYDKMKNACFARVMFVRDSLVVVKLEPNIKEQAVVVSISDDTVGLTEKMATWEESACQNPLDRS